MPRPKPRLLESAEGVRVLDAAYSPDGRTVAGVGGVVGKPGVLLLWDAASGEIRRRLRLSGQTGTKVTFSPVGCLLATCRQVDSHVTLWDAATWKPRRKLPLVPPGSPPDENGLPRSETITEHLAYSPDGRRLAAGCWDAYAKVWDVATGELRELSPRHRDNVDYVAFTGDGRALLTGTHGDLRVWSLPTGRLRKQVKLGGRNVLWRHRSLSDGRRAVSVGARGSLRVWDVKNLTFDRFSLPFDSPKAGVGDVAAAPDGRSLAIGLADGRILYWDLDQEAVTEAWPKGKRILKLQFRADGRELLCVRATAGAGTTVELHVPPPSPPTPAD